MDFIELGAPRQILMLQQMTVAYIALGSNLGDRHAIIEAAIHLIELIPGTRVTQTAACRETAPVDAPEGSPSFINTVSAVETSLKPEELMRHLLEIERDLGRKRDTQRNAPRVIDLDLLLFADRALASDSLVIPHPRMHRRQFVLEPLAELAPDLLLPGTGKTVQQHLAELLNTKPAVGSRLP